MRGYGKVLSRAGCAEEAKRICFLYGALGIRVGVRVKRLAGGTLWLIVAK